MTPRACRTCPLREKVACTEKEVCAVTEYGRGTVYRLRTAGRLRYVQRAPGCAIAYSVESVCEHCIAMRIRGADSG